jgi:hypothetical protein
MLLLLIALLPLDLAVVGAPPATAGGLRIESVIEGRRVGARLTNTGAAPLDLLIGYTCSGPQPFVAIIDGVERSFLTRSIECDKNVEHIERLVPGASQRVLSETLVLDGAAHELAVRYAPPAGRAAKLWHGALRSPPMHVPASTL